MPVYHMHPRYGCELLEPRTLLCYGADPVIEWNNIALNAILAEKDSVGPTFASRNLAMTHIAIFDAVNAIEGGYQPYLYSGTAPADASVDAAVATAASDVLTAVFPAYAAYIQSAYDDALAAIPDGAGEDDGVAVGHAAAQAILEARANDNSANVPPYVYGSDPGDYRPTPPDYATPPLGTGWGLVAPFGISDIDAYFPPPPPALTSCEYAQDFNQVKRLGAANSTARTAEQTEIAIFWRYDAQSYGTPLVLYNQITQAIAEQEHNSLFENARLFALANISMADAAIVTWAAKFTYDLWRPVTAIRQANTDGNPRTHADPNWLPLGFENAGISNRTPPFPSYTSGHATFGSAMFRTIAGFYGTNCISFSATSDELPGVVRNFNTLSQAAKENSISRVYLGVHFNFDCVQGLISGRDIGAHDVANLLLPIGSDGSETEVCFPVVSRDRINCRTGPCHVNDDIAEGMRHFVSFQSGHSSLDLSHSLDLLNRSVRVLWH